MLMTWTETVKWLNHTSWIEVSEVTQETLNLSLCHSPFTTSGSGGAGKRCLSTGWGTGSAGRSVPGVPARHDTRTRTERLRTDWEAMETFSHAITCGCPATGTPRQRPAWSCVLSPDPGAIAGSISARRICSEQLPTGAQRNQCN